ncbi:MULTISPECIES: tripartite tricarboxylate transporter permease [unclassified Meiothermus]|uniref:tripartite tricarboxylate transporter permease n=1 Tax=unclassified Meiothermus TaxID=370471 RepID=UPI000D7C0A95|nr:MULTISPECIES: tripartite tricarboxylate transporter permease [unclassified Meiothermus]PZA06205.1 C4-dicarboxylate ABC transporter [Meiothermus sp. Pnk-1]RYM37460.1 C4-dicarboxylate ABC transporter [Meiothermus sp. PNK-Is4]
MFGLDAFFALLLGVVYGLLKGVLFPGIPATLSLVLVLPILIFLSPAEACAAVIGLTTTAIFTGDAGSVMVRVPGTPASAAYTEEIHEVGRTRSPAFALGLSTVAATVGGLISILFLVVGSLGLAQVAKLFSSVENTWVVMMGVISGIFGAASLLKGVLGFAFGMLLGTVGVDPSFGTPRFTFNNPYLLGGIEFIVALIALFGVSEGLYALYAFSSREARARAQAGSGFRQLLRTFFLEAPRAVLRERWLLLRSSLIGVFIGLMPGAGSDTAAWMSANFARLRRDHKPEQVTIAGAAGSDSTIAGDWIPTLALGIPGDTMTTVVLGMFMALGITPGPALFKDQLGLVFQIYLAFFLSAVVFRPVVGFLAVMLVSRITQIPRYLLLGAVTSLCIVGAYAINRNPDDLYLLPVLGLFGFLLRKSGFTLGPIVLGLVLGPLLEQNVTMSLIKANGDLLAFFDRPLAAALALVDVVLVLSLLYLRRREAAAKPQTSLVGGYEE